MLRCTNRKEVLAKVGAVWEKYDLIKSKIPRDNVQAVCLAITDERALVQDALEELQQSKDMVRIISCNTYDNQRQFRFFGEFQKSKENLR